jgi:hypothetical protein
MHVQRATAIFVCLSVLSSACDPHNFPVKSYVRLVVQPAAVGNNLMHKNKLVLGSVMTRKESWHDPRPIRWDLWWTKWHWYGVFSESFGFSSQFNSTPSLHTV